MLSVTKDQLEIINDESRFKVTRAGRRWGKTHLALFDSLINKHHGAWVKPKKKTWYVSPTYRQSKNIAWQMLKEICYEHPHTIRQKNETELYVEMINGSSIHLKGADKEDSLRGVGLDHIILDEFEYMKYEAWSEVLRPTLTDTQGTAMFIGTPDGYGNLYDVYIKGEKGESGYKSWKFKTIDSPFISADEIEFAKSELDERTFRQEYEASFETATGRVYYAFDRAKNVVECEYDSNYQIKLALDFNVSPMKWAVFQTKKNEDFVIDELVQINTNTEEMTKTIGDRYGYAHNFLVYGDYSGTFRSTSSRSTDYDIIKEILPNAEIRIQPNPSVVDRVNSTNTRLCNAKGIRRMFVSSRCKHVIRDWEQVIWKEGKREIDKNNVDLTHISDGLGYYTEYEYSLKGKPQITHRFR